MATANTVQEPANVVATAHIAHECNITASTHFARELLLGLLAGVVHTSWLTSVLLIPSLKGGKWCSTCTRITCAHIHTYTQVQSELSTLQDLCTLAGHTGLCHV